MNDYTKYLKLKKLKEVKRENIKLSNSNTNKNSLNE